jgi:hypothetical protein
LMLEMSVLLMYQDLSVPCSAASRLQVAQAQTRWPKPGTHMLWCSDTMVNTHAISLVCHGVAI